MWLVVPWCNIGCSFGCCLVVLLGRNNIMATAKQESGPSQPAPWWLKIYSVSNESLKVSG